MSLRIWRVFLFTETWYKWESWSCLDPTMLLAILTVRLSFVLFYLFLQWGCHTMRQYWKWGHFKLLYTYSTIWGLTLKRFSFLIQSLLSFFVHIYVFSEGQLQVSHCAKVSTSCWLKQIAAHLPHINSLVLPKFSARKLFLNQSLNCSVWWNNQTDWFRLSDHRAVPYHLSTWHSACW